MIKDKYVEFTWITNFSKHFLALGYEKKKQGEKFIVKVEDLPENSYVKVTCVCDHCGDEFPCRYAYAGKREVHFCEKNECRIERINYYIKQYHDVDYSGQIPEAIEKRVETFKSHFGKEENPENHQQYIEKMQKSYFKKTGYLNPSQNPEVRKRVEETNLEKYGFRNPLVEDPERRKKAIVKSMKTRRERGLIKTSKYQSHLHDILETSELNYPVDRIAIDIAFLGEMIGLEYNGAGHYFAYLCGYETLEDKKKKDMRRAYFLKSQGWKLIFIDHTNVKKRPFTDDNVIKIISLTKQHLLNTKHKWVRIDYDNNRIYGKGFELFTNDEGHILWERNS